MGEQILYSADRIREIRTQCADLLRAMEERAGRIRHASREAVGESTNTEEAELAVVEMTLRQALEGYRTQIGHLETAADLYDRCSSAVYLEAEQAIQKGGPFH